MTKDFIRASLIRAVKTFFQTILGLWTAGALITQLDWRMVLLSAASAAVYSILTSIVTGLPEVTYPMELTDEEVAEAWTEEVD